VLPESSGKQTLLNVSNSPQAHANLRLIFILPSGRILFGGFNPALSEQRSAAESADHAEKKKELWQNVEPKNT
jgi:hypothetical protein